MWPLALSCVRARLDLGLFRVANRITAPTAPQKSENDGRQAERQSS